MVKSYKMNESEMGYRGSKSESMQIGSVKEQRVDGSYCISPVNVAAKSKVMQLRCTLMGFERNYQVRILSNK